MKYLFLFLFFTTVISKTYSQAFNPYAGAIDWSPNSGIGLPSGTFNCGQQIVGRSRINITGPANSSYASACVPATFPLIIDFELLGGASFIGATANDAVVAVAPGPLWEGYFNWVYSNVGKTIIRATQIQSIPLDGIGLTSTRFDFSVQVPIALGTFTLKSTIVAPLLNATCQDIDEANINLNSAGGDTESTNGTIWCQILPLQALEFKSLNKEKNGIALTWKTLNEINTSEFEIERSYDQNLRWTVIGKKAAAGHSNAELLYDFMDQNASLGKKIYYRIKQIDMDGNFKYTNIRSILPNNNLPLVLEGYPNPTRDRYTIHIESKSEEVMQLEIFDLLGRSISKQKLDIRKGSNSQQVLLNGISAGTYLLKVSGASVSNILTVVKMD